MFSRILCGCVVYTLYVLLSIENGIVVVIEESIVSFYFVIINLNVVRVFYIGECSFLGLIDFYVG